MPLFNVKISVTQPVTRNISVLINSKSPKSAAEAALSSALSYPNHIRDGDVQRIMSDKDEYWEPTEYEVLTVEHVK